MGRHTARYVLAFSVLLLVSVILTRAWWLPLFGHFLVVPDRPGKADVILVLAGSYFERTDKGIDLYRQGYSGRIMTFVPGRTHAYDAFATLLDSQLSFGDMLKLYFASKGLPKAAILVDAARKVYSTQDERDTFLQLARQMHLRSVLVVTSPYHLRRALTLFRGPCASAGIEVYHMAAASANQRPGIWWRDPGERQAVLVEYISLLDAFTGEIRRRWPW